MNKSMKTLMLLAAAIAIGVTGFLWSGDIAPRQ